MEHQNNGQCNHGTVEQWNIGTVTLEQWNKGTMAQWNIVTI